MRTAPLLVLTATLLLSIPAQATLMFSQDTFVFDNDPWPHLPMTVELFGIDEGAGSFRLRV